MRLIPVDRDKFNRRQVSRNVVRTGFIAVDSPGIIIKANEIEISTADEKNDIE